MSIIANLKDDKGNTILPKTLEKLVYDDDGVSLDKKVNKIFSLSLNGNVLNLMIDGIVISSVSLPTGGEVETYGNIIVDKPSVSVEEGNSTTIKVKLDSAPTNNQIVTLSENSEFCSVNPQTLTFTTSNFGTEQSITINTIKDDTSTESKSVILTLSSPNVSNKTVSVEITNSSTEPPITHDSLNMYHRENFNQNGFYDPNNGTIKSDATYGGTDKFEVIGGKDIVFNGVNGCFFDASNNFVSGISFNTTVPKTATVPTTAKYFSFALDKNKSVDGGYLYYTPIPSDDITYNTNLIVIDEIEYDGYYDSAWIENSSFASTGKIKVVPNIKYSQTGGVSVRAYNKYDKLVGIVVSSAVVPYGSEYIRMAMNKGNATTATFKLIEA